MDNDKFEVYKSTMRKMMRIGRLHRTIFERNISKMGIHHSQHHLLMYIAYVGEVKSQKEIADKFGVSPAAVARSLKTLEAEGFISRTNIGGDNRYNKITITEKGKEIVNKSHVMFKETDESIFEDFSDGDIEKFNEYLERMQSKLLEKSGDCCCMRRTNEKEQNN